MNQSSASVCSVGVYLNLCASLKVILLVPGFCLNAFVLISLVSCMRRRESKIRRNVAIFILGSTGCNIINLMLWPLTIHWKAHGRWLLGSTLCEIMVSLKHLTSSASFHYTSFISFSVYLTIVHGCSRAVNRKTFLALQLLFPHVPVLVKELAQHILGTRAVHLDNGNQTCFSFVNDGAMPMMMLGRIVVFLPLNLYFYAHILCTIFKSAKDMHRSQAANKRLAKIFSVNSLITVMAHIPGGVFSLLADHKVCLEMVMELLLDLPLLSSPIVLLCMNKELRERSLLLLKRKGCSKHKRGHIVNEQDKSVPASTSAPEALQSSV